MSFKLSDHVTSGQIGEVYKLLLIQKRDKLYMHIYKKPGKL